MIKKSILVVLLAIGLFFSFALRSNAATVITIVAEGPLMDVAAVEATIIGPDDVTVGDFTPNFPAVWIDFSAPKLISAFDASWVNSLPNGEVGRFSSNVILGNWELTLQYGWVLVIDTDYRVTRVGTDYRITPMGDTDTCYADADCDDGLFCTGAETCDTATNSCLAGVPPDCDDGIGCTADTCDEINDTCASTPDDASCDDGLFCTGHEICDPAIGCLAGLSPCDLQTEECNDDLDVCEAIGFPDADGDGYSADVDCDDTDPYVHPGANEVCNGIDDNCDDRIDEAVLLTFYHDSDSDNFGNPAQTLAACEAVAGYVADNTDCNDADADVNPAAAEVCNGADDNCDDSIDEGCATYYSDSDSDGYGNPAVSMVDTSQPPGYTANAGDCNDTDPEINPGATEVCDNLDNNCDGGIDEELTRPTACGVGACVGNAGTETCTAGTWGGDTCDPLLGAKAEACDNLDNDCNGQVDEGFDLDTDGIADCFDACPADPDNDIDGDDVCGDADNCPTVPNLNQADTNSDGFGDACVSSDAHISPEAVLGANPIIGSGSKIAKGALAGDNLSVGDRTKVKKYATLGDEATLGDAVVIGNGAVIGNAVIIGDLTKVRKDSILAEDVSLGEEVVVGIAAVIGNGVAIGDRTKVRKNATLVDAVTLGDEVVIGMAAVIGQGATIGDQTKVRKEATLGDAVTLGVAVVIGHASFIGNDVTIGDRTKVKRYTTIGNGTLIGSDCVIGKDCVIGNNVTILPGTSPTT